MNHSEIFISYSSKDKDIVYQLVTDIEKAGFTCWIAPRNIEGGAEYSEVIEKAILKSQIFLLIFSENSEKSPWVKSELNIAFSENKYIIPYKIDAAPLKGTMRLLLNDKHWIEKSNEENKQVNLLLSAIKNYFVMLEKSETDIPNTNPYYANIVKTKNRKKIFVGVALLVFLIAIGAVIFFIVSVSNKNNIKQYNDFIERAFLIAEISVDDIITKRNLLIEAQKFENEIPAFKRKDFSTTLFQLDFKLDSIHDVNIENARWFAKPETKHGDKQAIECYRLALQAREDAEARAELKIIIARKDNYE
jgi:hypothetical protein